MINNVLYWFHSRESSVKEEKFLLRARLKIKLGSPHVSEYLRQHSWILDTIQNIKTILQVSLWQVLHLVIWYRLISLYNKETPDSW